MLPGIRAQTNKRACNKVGGKMTIQIGCVFRPALVTMLVDFGWPAHQKRSRQKVTRKDWPLPLLLHSHKHEARGGGTCAEGEQMKHRAVCQPEAFPPSQSLLLVQARQLQQAEYRGVRISQAVQSRPLKNSQQCCADHSQPITSKLGAWG